MDGGGFIIYEYLKGALSKKRSENTSIDGLFMDIVLKSKNEVRNRPYQNIIFFKLNSEKTSL